MEYDLKFTPFFEKQLKGKDKILLQKPGKKLKELRHNPEHFKPLRNRLKGNRAAHLDPFVIVFNQMR